MLKVVGIGAGVVLAVLGGLGAAYVVAMSLLLGGISGGSPQTERQAFLLGVGYAVPPLLCALAGIAGAVAAGRNRPVLGGVLTGIGWVGFAAVVGLLIAPGGHG